MRLTRREAIGKAVRWTFIGTIAASLVEGVVGVDRKTGRCNCLFCQAERCFSNSTTSDVPEPRIEGKEKPS